MALSSPPRGFNQGDLLLVVHDFTARGPDELTLRHGDKIELLELDDGFGDGWFLGKDIDTGVTGLFPGVYTTRAPKIKTKNNGIGGEAASLGSASQESTESVSSPKSEDSTPHASRHASLTDLRAGQETGELGAPFTSPKTQQQRSSSSPLPTSKMAIDIQQSMRQNLNPNGQDSPVMNETLSVIDEHITDLSTPRHSVNAHDTKVTNDSASEYSSHLEHRMSYINGHETDEEEGNQQTEEQVRNWGAPETAKQLRELGIEEKHCEIFQEQEISGDVLLDMNQDFIFMKEFDFGVMGRRLKTWHKIKTFQEQTKGFKDQQTSTARGSTAGFSSDERPLSRTGQTGPLRPRIPGHRGSFSGAVQHPRLISSTMQSNTSSPITPQTPQFMDHTRRPSAASIREINHSRRHSSIDATSRYSTATDSPRIGSLHHKQGSFDRGWTMSSGVQQRMAPRPGTALGASNDTSRVQHTNGSDSAIAVVDELDRGYFSGPEVDTRTQRRLLHKRIPTGGSVRSVHSNITDEQLRTNRRNSRMSSVESVTDIPPNGLHAGVTYPPPPAKGRFRSLSTRVSDRHGQQSSRTTTSATEKSSGGFFSSFTHFGKSDAKQDTKHDAEGSRSTPMPLQQIKNAAPKFRRAVGLRAMSDVIGKGIDTSAAPASPVRDFDPSTRTGSTTPSTSKSSERHSTDGSGKAVEGGISFPRPRPSLKSGPKSKKDTSAYTRGLEKKSPQEQMQGCDYSGWMKKRSSNIMTTWKPRLFVLRGRRLSYYYSENDTEERGLIDITAHRVLRADNDPIVALHATITGATASPSSPVGSNNGDGSTSEKGSTSESLRGPRAGGEGPFFFKLIPPKTGSSRTVQFTKPAIHYFQVASVEEGRLWMAALVKATIERDMELPVETTNKQRTISLKEARLMNQRPPALMGDPDNTEEESGDKAVVAADEDTIGLMIKGLNIDQISSEEDGSELKRSSQPLGGLDPGLSPLLLDPVRKSG